MDLDHTRFGAQVDRALGHDANFLDALSGALGACERDAAEGVGASAAVALCHGLASMFGYGWMDGRWMTYMTAFAGPDLTGLRRGRIIHFGT